MSQNVVSPSVDFDAPIKRDPRSQIGVGCGHVGECCQKNDYSPDDSLENGNICMGKWIKLAVHQSQLPLPNRQIDKRPSIWFLFSVKHVIEK